MPATFSVLEIQLSPFLLATFSKKYLQKTEEVFKAKSIDTLKVVARQFPEQFDAVIF